MDNCNVRKIAEMSRLLFILTGTTPKNKTQFDPNQQERDFKKKVAAVLVMSE